MGQREGFTGGFIAGAIVGGLMGGIVGSLLAARSQKKNLEDDLSSLPTDDQSPRESEADMEMARRRLEDKISQLNHAIDDVRQQLGTVNGNPQSEP